MTVSLAQRAHDAYANATIPIRSNRSMEYDAISKITHRLRSAAEHRDDDFPAFASALSDNRRLWTTLAMDVAQTGNGLPEDLRARLFWLAEFTEFESRKLLRKEGDIGILIEINASILQGLRGQERSV